MKAQVYPVDTPPERLTKVKKKVRGASFQRERRRSRDGLCPGLGHSCQVVMGSARVRNRLPTRRTGQDTALRFNFPQPDYRTTSADALGCEPVSVRIGPLTVMSG